MTTPLTDILAARIRADGPISMSSYMAECLLHPTHGYYTTRDPLGADGDFTTAPEISQMFGELLGLCLAQSWLDQGSPAPSIHAMGGPLRRQRSGKGPVVSVPTLRRGTRRRPVEVRLRHRDAHARGRVEIRSSPRPISEVSEHNPWA